MSGFFHGSGGPGRRRGARAAILRSWENRLDPATLEEDAMDKKAKTPKKPKQTKSKDGAAKAK
jgi:hypothetical protein